mmetsp:Transcript_24329/g.69085  ORF Transcript_24329/g.69085 Transcript_24329/m.69085 type:complete len:214 (-) Transcript_24329:68-709(-)
MCQLGDAQSPQCTVAFQSRLDGQRSTLWQPSDPRGQGLGQALDGGFAGHHQLRVCDQGGLARPEVSGLQRDAVLSASAAAQAAVASNTILAALLPAMRQCEGRSPSAQAQPTQSEEGGDDTRLPDSEQLDTSLVLPAGHSEHLNKPLRADRAVRPHVGIGSDIAACAGHGTTNASANVGGGANAGRGATSDTADVGGGCRSGPKCNSAAPPTC